MCTPSHLRQLTGYRSRRAWICSRLQQVYATVPKLPVSDRGGRGSKCGESCCMLPLTGWQLVGSPSRLLPLVSLAHLPVTHAATDDMGLWLHCFQKKGVYGSLLCRNGKNSTEPFNSKHSTHCHGCLPCTQLKTQDSKNRLCPTK